MQFDMKFSKCGKVIGFFLCVKVHGKVLEFLKKKKDIFTQKVYSGSTAQSVLCSKRKKKKERPSYYTFNQPMDRLVME